MLKFNTFMYIVNKKDHLKPKTAFMKNYCVKNFLYSSLTDSVLVSA